MINKKTIEAQKYCSKDKTKEQLQGVYIKDNIAIATDSFKLVRITKKDLPEKVVPEGIYNLDKYTPEIDIEKRKINGEFPDTSFIFSELKPVNDVLLNGKILNEAVAIFKDCLNVKLELNQDKKALKFTSENDTQKIEVLLMPLYK